MLKMLLAESSLDVNQRTREEGLSLINLLRRWAVIHLVKTLPADSNVWLRGAEVSEERLLQALVRMFIS